MTGPSDFWNLSAIYSRIFEGGGIMNERIEQFAERLIEKYYAEASENIMLKCDKCCANDTFDALDAECEDLKYELKKILEEGCDI